MISSNVRTQVVVFQEGGSVIMLIIVEIGLMNRIAVSDGFLHWFIYILVN